MTDAAQEGYFLLWGEMWRRVEPVADLPVAVQPHPFVMNPTELTELLQRYQSEFQLQLPTGSAPTDPASIAATVPAKGRRKTTAEVAPSNPFQTLWQTAVLAAPTIEQQPQLSNLVMHDAMPLFPWSIAGLRLTVMEAYQFLTSLPLSRLGEGTAFIGSDLRFWSHLARWGLDLLARGKFLPKLLPTETGGLAQWQVLLDSATDQERLNRFSQQIPIVCCLYGSDADAFANPLPRSPQTIITQFLNHILDAQIRHDPQTKQALAIKTASPLKPWLEALVGTQTILAAETFSQIAPNIQPWLAPLEQSIDQFRTCLTLIPPQTGGSNWLLEYGLQAIAEPEFVVSSDIVWQNSVAHFVVAGHPIEHPQETLLAGLGLASRVYPVLEQSLQTARPISCELNPVQAYQFLRETAWRLQESGVGVILPPSLANREGWANRLGLKVSATTASRAQRQKQKLGLQGLLNFQWELAIGGHSLSKREFDRLVALNTPLVEINGEWVELRPQDIKAAQNFFAVRKEQPQLTLEDALRLSSGDTQTIEKLPVVSFESSGALQELVTNLTDSQSIEPINPTKLKGELRPYQARGVGWLAFLEKWGLGACLADDMGLGKTLQLIAFILHLQEQDLLENPVLIVCPTSVLGNWEREVKRFAPSLKVKIHHGDKRPQGQAFAKQAKTQHLIITSYALVQRDLNTLKTVEWQGVVLDEAQNVKNAEAKQSQAVRQLECQFHIALTGTPVENRLTELWSIMDFLNPGYLGAKNYFQRRFAIPIERYGDMTSLQALRALAQPFILRRLKTDKTIIQDLPEKQEMTAFCGLSVAQANLYQTMVEETLEKIEESTGIQRRGMILGLLTKLKQVCNHPYLITDQTDVTDEFRTQSGKLQRLEEMLEVALAEGDRALIFTQFAEWGKLLQKYLQQRLDRQTLFLYGSSTKNQREAMVDRFQNDPQGPQIFILSLKAGGVGLNLTRANHVFHFDRWWNPAVENQATDRVFRIGQHRNVQVHKFVCNGTLEERIHDMIESKKALAEQVVGTGENWLTELNTDQLRDLLLLDRSAILGDDSAS
jgi:SNF2 family DNA or RNA helicase